MNNKYFCFYCNYDAKQKSNYEKHILTKKHLTNKKTIRKSPKSHQKSPFFKKMSPKSHH